MTAVAVLVPWRSGCSHRAASYEWARARYTTHYPDWEVIEGTCPPGPWRKALAVDDALSKSSSDVVVVADADVAVWCGGMTAAVAALTEAPWVIPHNLIHRLTETATQDVLDGVRPESFLGDAAGHAQRPYRGCPGGGITVLPADLLRAVPLDARFEGWGGEDAAWAHALTVIAGKPVRLNADLWHLWHPPAPRLTRVKGSHANWALKERYRRARTPEAMRALIDEARVTA